MSVSFYFSRESLKARVWGLRAWVVQRRQHHPQGKPPLLCLHEGLWGTGYTTGHLGKPMAQNPPVFWGRPAHVRYEGLPKGNPLPFPPQAALPLTLVPGSSLEFRILDNRCRVLRTSVHRLSLRVLARSSRLAVTGLPPTALVSWPGVAPLRRDTLVATPQTRGQQGVLPECLCPHPSPPPPTILLSSGKQPPIFQHLAQASPTW